MGRARADPRDGVRAVQQARHARGRRGPDHRRGGRGEDDAVSQLRLQGRADRGLPGGARGALDARLAAGRGRAPADTPAGRLLAIFDVFGEWFALPDFEGCSFINVMLELTDREEPGRVASVHHLSVIREFLAALAEEAGVDGPRGVRAPVAHPDEGLDRRRRRGRRARRRARPGARRAAARLPASARTSDRTALAAAPRVGEHPLAHEAAGAGSGAEREDERAPVASRRPRTRRCCGCSARRATPPSGG